MTTVAAAAGTAAVVLNADSTTFTGAIVPTTGTSDRNIVMWCNTSGTSTTDPLLAFYDTAGSSALPVTPNTGDITVDWHDTDGAIKFTNA